jgi:large subunit ribosomal protein L24
MKKKFSPKWIASKQPRKQHKFRANAPLHTKHRFLSALLAKALRKKYGKRSLPIRKGDEVLVMRGSNKKTKAKVASVDLKRTRITLENVQRTKKDGTKVNVFFNPSSLQLLELNLDDKSRIKVLEKNMKKAKPETKAEKTKEKKNAPKKK